MRAVDFVKARGIAIATLVITLAASFPMVAFYAFFIEPGHPRNSTMRQRSGSHLGHRMSSGHWYS